MPEDTSPEWQATEYAQARLDLQTEVAQGTTLNDIRRRYNQPVVPGDDRLVVPAADVVQGRALRNLRLQVQARLGVLGRLPLGGGVLGHARVLPPHVRADAHEILGDLDEGDVHVGDAVTWGEGRVVSARRGGKYRAERTQSRSSPFRASARSGRTSGGGGAHGDGCAPSVREGGDRGAALARGRPARGADARAGRVQRRGRRSRHLETFISFAGGGGGGNWSRRGRDERIRVWRGAWRAISRGTTRGGQLARFVVPRDGDESCSLYTRKSTVEILTPVADLRMLTWQLRVFFFESRTVRFGTNAEADRFLEIKKAPHQHQPSKRETRVPFSKRKTSQDAPTRVSCLNYVTHTRNVPLLRFGIARERRARGRASRRRHPARGAGFRSPSFG